MKAEKLLEHIKYLQNEWYESEIENLRLRDQVEELEMQLTPTRNALAKAIKESKQKDAEIQALKNATAENSDEAFEN